MCVKYILPEIDEGGHDLYPEGDLYLVLHTEEGAKKATRAWGSITPKDAIFIKALVDWFQSMTQAKNQP